MTLAQRPICAAMNALPVVILCALTDGLDERLKESLSLPITGHTTGMHTRTIAFPMSISLDAGGSHA